MKTAICIIIACFLAIMNIISFILMGIDKRRAVKGAWRIPEKALFLSDAVFGGIGGLLGMIVFHHKTKHVSFRILFPLFLILQCAVLIFCIFYFRLLG